VDPWLARSGLDRCSRTESSVVDVAFFAEDTGVRRLPPPPGAVWLKLTKGRYALVDAADYAAVSQLSWHLHTPSKRRGKPKSKTRYARTMIPADVQLMLPRRSVYLHRWLWERWGRPPTEHIDHDGGDGLDCRSSKLRAATHDQNQRARSYKNKLGLKGVSKKGSRFVARITLDGDRGVRPRRA